MLPKLPDPQNSRKPLSLVFTQFVSFISIAAIGNLWTIVAIDTEEHNHRTKSKLVNYRKLIGSWLESCKELLTIERLAS